MVTKYLRSIKYFDVFCCVQEDNRRRSQSFALKDKHIISTESFMLHIKSMFNRLETMYVDRFEERLYDKKKSQHYMVNHLWITQPSILRRSSRPRRCSELQPNATHFSTNKESKH